MRCTPSILGPILFLIYSNDFESCLQYSKVIHFADDTVVYVSGKSAHDIEIVLNEETKSISEYFTKNPLVINLKVGKTE